MQTLTVSAKPNHSKSRDFCYKLQGFFEITNATSLDANQVKMIREMLNYVFAEEIDKQYSDPEKSQDIHDGVPVNNSNRIVKC